MKFVNLKTAKKSYIFFINFLISNEVNNQAWSEHRAKFKMYCSLATWNFSLLNVQSIRRGKIFVVTLRVSVDDRHQRNRTWSSEYEENRSYVGLSSLLCFYLGILISLVKNLKMDSQGSLRTIFIRVWEKNIRAGKLQTLAARRVDG